MSFLSDSMSAISRRHGLSRAAMSKLFEEMAAKLGVLLLRAMRMPAPDTSSSCAMNERLMIITKVTLSPLGFDVHEELTLE